ncbi:putative ATPase [Desulfofundulus luciae]|uniref:ATPase n=1 Tax=Desulfofundulus luciae TaxID=74702 RepID=A0ABU0B0N6_9FIRM|nr:AAA family ATPase [Desulfofundulus luciae]MDQ0286288.1 putative ATPase [Desulfofundulus luciae]
MSDQRNRLQKMFDFRNRFSNFGDVLIRLHVKGFRCHTNTLIEINSPITAFCGLNGTGKSTLLQLAAAAYRPLTRQERPYYLRDFFVVGTLDPMPFTRDASVEYKYWQHDRNLKTVTLSRNDITRRWQGYSRRPQRNVFFAGVGLYIPKIEQRDFFFRHASKLVVRDSSSVTDRIKLWTCRILGHSYESISTNIVIYSEREGNVVTVQRSGATYSEAHMGYGEGRTQYLINTLEILPEKSLVLIEEPETSLHPSAQHELGKYLVDVACERKHQIMITTHSEFILEALPSQSRIYLKKVDDGVYPIAGLTALQAKSLMTEGHVKALHILVEDNCAKTILSEIIRRIDPDFLRSVGIYPVGDADTIVRTIRTLKSTGLPVAAVRDADKGGQPSENIFKLPGSLPPEKELFSNIAVKKYMLSMYGVNLDDFKVSHLEGVDHHEWFQRLSNYLNMDEAALVSEAARIYARSLSEVDIVTLIAGLKEVSRR